MKAMTELLSWMKKRSSASNELAMKAEAELAALREAGEKMKARLDYDNPLDRAAYDAWEAANK